MPPKASVSAPKTRGRPRKADAPATPQAPTQAKKRGRPAKATAVVINNSPVNNDTPKVKLQGRGRVRKQAVEEEAGQAEEPKSRQKRTGRTTQASKEDLKKVAGPSRVTKSAVTRRPKLTADQEIAASPVVRSRVRKTRTANPPPNMKSLVADEHPARRGQAKGKGGRPAKSAQTVAEPQVKKTRGRKPAAAMEAKPEVEEKKTRGRKPNAATAETATKKAAGRKAGKGAVVTEAPAKKTAGRKAGRATLGQTAVSKPAERRTRAPNGMTTMTVPKWAVKALTEYLKGLEAAKDGEAEGQAEEEAAGIDSSTVEGAAEEVVEEDHNAKGAEEQPMEDVEEEVDERNQDQPVQDDEDQPVEKDVEQPVEDDEETPIEANEELPTEDDNEPTLQVLDANGDIIMEDAGLSPEELIEDVPALIVVQPLDEEDNAGNTLPVSHSSPSQFSAVNEPASFTAAPTSVTVQHVEVEVEVEEHAEHVTSEHVGANDLEQPLEYLDAGVVARQETSFDDIANAALEANQLEDSFDASLAIWGSSSRH